MHSVVMTLEVMLSAEAAVACGTSERFRFLLIVSSDVGLEVKLALRGYSSNKSEPIAKILIEFALQCGHSGHWNGMPGVVYTRVSGGVTWTN